METELEGGPRPAEVGAVTAAPQTMDQALETIREGHGSWSVVVSPRRWHTQTRRLIYQARAAEEETLIALHVTELSPLGATVLTEMAQRLIPALPAEHILPALAALESQMRCLTVTPSLMDMNEPKVPLWLHARSWIPGGTYIAERGGTVRGYSAKRSEKVLDRIPPADEGYIAAVAASPTDKRRSHRVNSALEALVAHVDPDDVVRRQNEDPGWWGSRSAAQVVLAPTNLGAAIRQAADTEPVLEGVPARTLCAPALPRALSAGLGAENAGDQLAEEENL